MTAGNFPWYTWLNDAVPLQQPHYNQDDTDCSTTGWDKLKLRPASTLSTLRQQAVSRKPHTLGVQKITIPTLGILICSHIEPLLNQKGAKGRLAPYAVQPGTQRLLETLVVRMNLYWPWETFTKSTLTIAMDRASLLERDLGTILSQVPPFPRIALQPADGDTSASATGGGAIRFAAAQSVLWADQLVPDADWIGLTVMAKPLSRAVLPNDIISLDGRPVAIATEAPRSITDNTKLMNSLVGPPPYLRADFLVLVKRQHFAAVRKHLATQGVAVDGRNWAAVKSRFVDAVDPESSISLILNWMHKHAKNEYSWQPTAHTQESSLTGTTPTTMASLVAGLTPVQKLLFKSREKIWQAGSDIPATTTTDLSTVSHRPGSGYPGHEPTPTTSPCYADYTPGPLSISSICCGQAGKHNRKDLDRSKSCPTWRRKCRGYTANVVMGACEATDADGKPPTPPFP